MRKILLAATAIGLMARIGAAQAFDADVQKFLMAQRKAAPEAAADKNTEVMRRALEALRKFKLPQDCQLVKLAKEGGNLVIAISKGNDGLEIVLDPSGFESGPAVNLPGYTVWRSALRYRRASRTGTRWVEDELGMVTNQNGEPVRLVLTRREPFFLNGEMKEAKRLSCISRDAK